MQMEISQRELSFTIDWFLQLQQDGRMVALLKRSGHPLDLVSQRQQGRLWGLGTVQHNRPDWFRESAMTLDPLLEERNRLYDRWLCSRSARDRQKFVRAI